MDRIQITTTKETAETCGYALMGCSNRLSAAIKRALDHDQQRLAGSLEMDRDNLLKIITAFAQADIVEDASQDAVYSKPEVGTAADNDSSGTSVAKEDTSSPDGASGGFLEFQKIWDEFLADSVVHVSSMGELDLMKATMICAFVHARLLKTVLDYDKNVTVRDLNEFLERGGE